MEATYASPGVRGSALGRFWRWWGVRPVLAATALYAVIACLFIGPGLLPRHTISGSDYLWSATPWTELRPPDVREFGANSELVDPVTVFQPFFQYTRDRLPEIPLWNPYIAGGRPFLANQQSAIFSPFTAPAYVLPFWWSLTVTAVLKLLVAALGTFLFARVLGMRFAGAFLAGLVFALSLYFVVWLPFAETSVWAFLPWLLWLTDRLVRRPSAGAVGALGAVVALQFFGGHPESSFHSLAAVAAYFAFRTVQLRATGGLVRPSLAFGGAVVLGGALAALTLVPFLELVNHSGDLERRAQGGARLVVDRKFLFGILLPDYWGRPTQSPLQGFAVVKAFYVGALPLMLAFVGLLGRPRALRLAIAAFGALSLAVVVGIWPVFQIVSRLPGFSGAYNTRLVIVFVLCAGLLAGWGLDDLVARRPTGRRAALILGFAGVLLLTPLVYFLAARTSTFEVFDRALGVAWAFEHPPFGNLPVVQLSALLIWLGVAGAAVVLLVLRASGRLAGGAFAGLAVLLIAADLFRAGMGENPALSLRQARQPVTPAIRYLQSRRPARFVGLLPALGAPALPADVGMRYRLYDARGYDYPVDRRYDRIWRRDVATGQPVQPQITLAPITPRSLPILSLFGVADIIQTPGDRPLTGPGLRVAYNGPDARVYANDRALPRAFLVGSQVPVSGDTAALRALETPGFDARGTVVTQRPLAGLPASGPTTARPAGDVRLSTYRPERVVLEARADRPAELVLSDVSYPDWEATVDGRPVRLDRVDYLFRGVRVDPGTHRVEMRYRPASWRAGWIISAVALLVLAALAATAVRRRRRAPAA